MSTLRVTNLKGGSAGSAPNLPDGANVTGVITATSFSGSGANLTGIDATALKDGGGSVKIQANSDGAVVTGVLTATTGSFTGNISVGGTLTYEDVTNVDSVGMVTARNGVKVLAGGINAVGVITATSFAGSGANLTGIDALPSVSGTASGAIAANRAVLIKTDGTYEQVTGVAQNMGSTRAFFDRYGVIAGAYNPDLSNFAFLYNDPGNGYYTTSVVGSISGTTISWGTPQVARSENGGGDSQAMGYDPTYNRYIGFTKNTGDSNKIRLLLGTASGTSITWNDWGNPAFTQANGADHYDVCYNTSGNLRHALVYMGGGSQICIAEFEVVNPGNSISVLASDYVWSSSGYNNCYICYDSTNNCYLVTATKQNNNWYGSVRVMNSGQLPSPPGQQWDMGPYVRPYGIAHDPVSGNTCVLWYNTSNYNLFLQSTTSVNTGSGNIQYGSAVQVNDGGSSFSGAGLTYDPNAKKFVVSYSYSTGGSHAITATVSSAGVITLDTRMVINAGGIYSTSAQKSMANLFDPSSNKIATVYQDAGNNIGNGSEGGYGRVITAGYNNLVADRYIGFSAEGATNGQTVKVKTKSNTVTQSGLTTTSRYYIQGVDGTVGSSPDNPSVDVGIALNSNNVLLQ